MRKILIKFCDYWANDQATVNNILALLNNYYEVEFSNNPEFVFYSCRGTEFLKYDDSIRIFFTDEAVTPDFNFCDYAIGFNRLSFGERYIRKDISVSKQQLKPDINYTNRKFCNFLYSNFANIDDVYYRNEFCSALMKYKYIDCPGKCLNNMPDTIGEQFIGDWCKSIINFQSQYKFTIAFENMIYPGYVTEKLINPFTANSIPIYFGDPDISIDYNTKAFINCCDFNSFEEVIDYIKFLDNDNEAYMDMLKSPAMNQNYEKPCVDKFILHIIEKGINYHRYRVCNGCDIQPYHYFNKLINSFWNNGYKELVNYHCKTQIPNLDDLLYVHKSLTPQYNKIFSRNDNVEIINLSSTYKSYISKFYGELSLHHEKMLANISAISFLRNTVTFVDDANLETRYLDFYNIIKPYRVNDKNKIRVGGNMDGGCVLLQPEQTDVVISAGLTSKSGAYDRDCDFTQLGCIVYQFDKNINSDIEFENINKHNLDIGYMTDYDKSIISISDVITNNNIQDSNPILVMDVEGRELEILERLDDDTLSKFSQIHIEFHGLLQSKKYFQIIQILKKILRFYNPIHIHFHNISKVYAFRNFIVCDVFQISFANKKLYRFDETSEIFPTALDYPNLQSLPDIYIGSFYDILHK